MMLDGGKVGNTRLLSRKSVELMTQDQLGKISPEQGFGLGFGIDGVKARWPNSDPPDNTTGEAFSTPGFPSTRKSR